MVDKVITLENDFSYYILDEYKSPNGEYYVFGVRVNEETEDVTSEYIFLKEINDLNETYYDNIKDMDEYEKVGNIFMRRLIE